ncbi:MAG: hypothetical protein NTW87_20360 [Planctomycetota bacterium]|nr:hypothetical protein [Planctomycetota bacterium]
MNTQPQNMLPTWAPRVTQREIRRLYEADAKGIYDEELINEVGYGLLARCQSFLDAVDAVRGKARCPRCASVVVHAGRKDEVLRCKCGWELAWAAYFKTIQHKQLSGAEPVLDQFRSFVQAFPAARTPQEKTILIDRLIHGFHWYYKTNAPTRPVAINLIEGRLSEVVAFLENLSSGAKSTAGVAENYAQWDERIELNSGWYASRRKRKAGPEGAERSDSHRSRA